MNPDPITQKVMKLDEGKIGKSRPHDLKKDN